MRTPALSLLLIPVAFLALGCNPKLSRSQAETLLAKGYPVVVTVIVPEQVTAVKGSPEALRLAALQANLEPSGWFDITKTEAGDREACTFRLKPGAPKTITAAPKGFALPAAQAVFVRANRMEPTREGARVTYQIRLANPTPQFPLFQALHPQVALGAMKERHATFARHGGRWELTGTDEAFRKAD
jgi:hypothetical protein